MGRRTIGSGNIFFFLRESKNMLNIQVLYLFYLTLFDILYFISFSKRLI